MEHAIEKAVIFSEGATLSGEHFQFSRKALAPNLNTTVGTIEEMEVQMIKRAIERNEGNLSAVAMELGITRQTLYNKLKKFGL